MTSPLAGLGRRRIADDRDHNHLMPRLASPRTSRYWSTPAAYDQGSTPMCVAYAGNRYLESAPVKNRPYAFSWLYRQCQLVDGLPDDEDGTTVRALFQVLKREGLVSEFKWAFSVEPLIDHVLEVGPVVMGTNYYEGMADPDRHGYVEVSGRNIGGHSWTVYGANRRKKNPDGSLGAARWMQSWGPKWGPAKGAAWITFNDLGRLIAEDGEAAIGIEVLGA